MIDSWGRFPTNGLLEGTWSDFGSYDECLETDIPIEKPSTSNTNQRIIYGQYCTVQFRPLMPPRDKYQNILHTIPLATGLARNLSSTAQVTIGNGDCNNGLGDDPKKFFPRFLSFSDSYLIIMLRMSIIICR